MKEQKPFRLEPNRMSYLIPGGKLIDDFLGEPVGSNPLASQLWIASVVKTMLGDGSDGYSRIVAADGGETLPERLAKDPEGMLGEAIVKRFGNTPGFLLKLLNSDDRLLVQTHPDGKKAKKYFDQPFGKTEAWYVLAVEPGQEAYIWAGFKPGITKAGFRKLIEEQDTKAILDCLHQFVIEPGDIIFIQAGVPHAMGSHSLVAEIQEPVDLTLRAERFRPDGSELPEESLHSGIGMDGLLDCFDFSCADYETTRKRLFVKPEMKQYAGYQETILIGSQKTSCFGMSRMDIKEASERENQSFTVGLVLAGEGQLKASDETILLQKGVEFFVPASISTYQYLPKEAGGVLTVLECYPPAAENMR